jgi:hypothetical protein
MWFDEWDCFADVAQLVLAQARRRNEQLNLVLVALAGGLSEAGQGGPIPPALERLATATMPALRSSDPAAPYDRRSLAILAVNTDRVGAERLVGRLEYALAGIGRALTGIATAPADGATLAELLAHAETELANALAE